MVELWYWLLVVTVAGFVILDGWDMGAGAMHLIVARNDPERRAVIGAIGPLWLWHEVWLLAGGGIMVLAFPAVIARGFSGFYLALYLVLWCLLGRGIAIEMAGHMRDSMWRWFWDVAFCISSALLAILFGAALGNVIRGMPIGADGNFALSFFTHFGVKGEVGILDWYTVSTGVISLVILSAHGMGYLAVRTSGALNIRAMYFAKLLWSLAFLLLVPVTYMTLHVRPGLFGAFLHRPIPWVFLLILLLGLLAVTTGITQVAERRLFLGGCGVILGLLGGAAASVFPDMLHSTFDARYSITAYSAAAAPEGLRIALWWWPIALVLSLSYVAYVAKRYSGKVSAEAPQDYGTFEPAEEPIK